MRVSDPGRHADLGRRAGRDEGLEEGPRDRRVVVREEPRVRRRDSGADGSEGQAFVGFGRASRLHPRPDRRARAGPGDRLAPHCRHSDPDRRRIRRRRLRRTDPNTAPTASRCTSTPTRTTSCSAACAASASAASHSWPNAARRSNTSRSAPEESPRSPEPPSPSHGSSTGCRADSRWDHLTVAGQTMTQQCRPTGARGC